MSKSRNLLRVLPLLLIFIAATMSMRTVLSGKGFIFKDDMTFPFEDDQVREALANKFSVWYGKIGGSFEPTLPSSIPFWVFYNFLNVVLRPELTGAFFIIILFTLAGSSMYMFSRRWISFPGSLLAAFLYMFNPWTFDRITSGHLNLLMGYALAPIPLMFVSRLREKVNFKDCVLAAFSLALILSFTMHFFALVFLLVTFYVVFMALTSKKLWSRKGIVSLVLVFTIALLLNFSWLLPTLANYPVIKASTIEPSVSGSIIETINRQATILNTLRLTGYWLPYFRDSVAGLGSFSTIWSIFSFFVPILAFAAIFSRRNKMAIFFGAVAVISLVPPTIASGYPEVYLRIIDYIPPLALFRDSYKFIGIVCFSYSFLIASLFETLASIVSKLKTAGKQVVYNVRFKRKAKVYMTFLAIGLLVTTSFVYIVPNVISGDYLGQLSSVTPPSYWFDVKGFLVERNDNSWRALWAPPFPELHYEWCNANSVDPVDEYLSPVYAMSLKSRNSYLSNYLTFLTSSMYDEYGTVYLGKLLAPLGVKYVIVRLDTAPKWREQQYPPGGMKAVFGRQIGLSEVFETGNWIVYENNYSEPCVTTLPLNIMLVFGDQSAIGDLSNLGGSGLPAILLIDSKATSPQDVEKLISLSNRAANITTLTVVMPMDQSIAASDDVLGQITGKVRTMYYIEGEKLDCEQGSIIPNHSFEDGLTHWNLNSSAFSMKLSRDAVDGQSSLEVTTNCNASDSWSWISSDNVSLVPRTVYKFSTNIKVSNGAKSRVEILGFNEMNESWQEICSLPSGLDGTQNWTSHEFLWQNSQNLTQIKVILNAGWVNDPSIGNATTFFDGINITPVVTYDFSFSNGSALPLLGTANTGVGLLTSSDYRIGLRLLSTEENQIKIRFYNNQTEQLLKISVGPDSLNFIYSEPVYLPSGNFRVELSSEKLVILDTLQIFSVEKENETLQDLFVSKEAPATVTSFKRVNPTNYVVNVSSTGPFLLSLSEAYDPSWIAYVRGQRIEPTPLYSAINGFWINQTGQLEITIAYEAQEWFYYGSTVSIAILFACVTYLAYDLAKNKGIRKRLEKIFKHLSPRHV